MLFCMVEINFLECVFLYVWVFSKIGIFRSRKDFYFRECVEKNCEICVEEYLI